MTGAVKEAGTSLPDASGTGTNRKLRAMHNQRGQKLGSKGNRTRQAILDVTRDMIFERPFREISGVEIAKQVGVSVATLYTYFNDVTAVIVALAEAVAEQTPDVSEMMARPWRDDDAVGEIGRMVDALVEFNMRHYPVIRLRNYLADEGNKELARIRSRAAQPFIAALARQITSHGRLNDPGESGEATAPEAVRTAGLLLGMIDRLTLLLMQSPYPQRSLSKEDYIKAATRIIYASVIASMPDEDA